MKWQTSVTVCLVCRCLLDAGVQADCPRPGYLQVIGPGAFRFEEPAIITVKRPMPPFPIKTEFEEDLEIPPSGTNSAPVKVETDSSTSPAFTNAVTETNPPAPKVEPAPVLIESTAKESQVINPAVLLKFFSGGKTNSNATAVAVPVGFTLPGSSASAPPPSSTATYTTKP